MGCWNIKELPCSPSILKKVPNCKFCKARRFQYEPPNFCCSKGSVKLVSHQLPSKLKSLYLGVTDESNHFRTYVRTYNNMFAFTSLGVKYNKELATITQGVYTFKVQGQMYHFINNLILSNNEARNLQLYFYDNEDDIVNKMAFSENLNRSVIAKLIDILKVNPYSMFLKSLRGIPNLSNFYIALKCDSALDQRTYNLPSVSEVAAIWVDDDSNNAISSPHIRIYTHCDSSQLVRYHYGCYDPLQYPLLFPYGENGWHCGIQKIVEKRSSSRNHSSHNQEQLPSVSNWCPIDGLLNIEEEILQKGIRKKNNVSCREYYCYKLQIRDNEDNETLHSGRLFQQYSVDEFIKVETQRLDFLLFNQDLFRLEVLAGLRDLLRQGERDTSKIGIKTFLPASFTGGPRDMRRRYMDAIALVQHFGKPDIFLTMTCNPSWPEIEDLLLPTDEVQNRPDLISRTFKAKVEELKSDIVKKGIFGKVVAFMYTIEFQKRGLPHAHFLIILADEYKLLTPEAYDKVICAEIPNLDTNHYLHSLVIKHMMHGPCRSLNPKSPCMIKTGHCEFKYPTSYAPETCKGKNSYPIYRRQDTGNFFKVRTQYLDNSWVVPYNPYLLSKFNCHINVEICSDVKVVKYIYKYICKGHDKIAFHVHSNDSDIEIDEIRDYRSARWVSPPEAMWRLFAFPISEMNPSVYHLQLHLKEQQYVSFKTTASLNSVLNNPTTAKTMLTEFFSMNATSAVTNELSLLYKEFPQYVVWSTSDRMWTRRIQGNVIGRIVTCHPTEGERYYLRLLLMNIRGPKSYEDLRTVDGRCCSTFREAAGKRGLLTCDNNLIECMSEATNYQMPYSLRRLFTTLLVLF
ncbi:uncharacterized protein LOC132631247 [Lycium barbarum]|uniref:uncharacterized protein LOC132631247 n=1 Tax=Lycium barbarum TaxID=112863 RepID=UPI00293EE8DA|nr:uncharacterized protein LOC132631247 [Lycium barbarum]